MKVLDRAAFEQIDTWMARNARPLEWALWRFHFHGGSREPVLDALRAYQNADGGFGHALEPDNWNPQSLPYIALYAVNLLRDIGVGAEDPLLSGALHFFENTEHRGALGWYFNVPGNNDVPHAPWWGCAEGPSPVESLGLSAGIAGLGLRFAPQGSPFHDLSMQYARQAMQAFQGDGSYGDMGISGGIALLRDIEAAGLADRLGTAALRPRLAQLASESIERDTEKWRYYGVLPSNYIDSPDSPYLPGNEDIVQAELDYLVDTLPADGVWGVPWSWFENNDRYAREWAISENWWRAIKAIEKVRFLRAFGRIAEQAAESPAS